jgi:type IV secretory pathway VirB4 component
VTGSSGSGKSFLNNCILLQYLSQNPLLYVIDIGGSYRKLAEFVEGQYIEITPPREGELNTAAINPFLLPSATKEPSPQKIKFLITLLETLLTDEDGDKLPKLDKSLIEESILATYARTLPTRMPRMSDLKAVFEASKEKSLRDYAKMLYPWTGSRPYGRLLDAASAIDLTADMVVFDLKSLSHYPDLQSVMILILTDFILGKIDSTPGRPKRILMDECWELLKSQAASSFMEYCARTLRKTGSGITFITQGLEEIERSVVGPAILNNTATKVILRQEGDLDAVRKTLKLNDQEVSLIGTLTQQKGVYSEAFLIAGDHRSVIRVTPTPAEYWLATSDAADNPLLDSVRARFPEMRLTDAIHYLAEHYPHGSGGVRELPIPEKPDPNERRTA